MCGFVVISSSSPDKVEQAITKMVHRGPDFQQIVVAGGVTLGHVRLSIVDLSSGSNQPFTDGENYLVFNGEIYNYVNVKKVLESAGIKFSTSGDTEVLFRLLSRGYASLISSLEGPFAFVYLDHASNKLIFSCDEFGEKQMYFSVVDNVIRISSTLGSLRELSPEPSSINENALIELKQCGYIGTDEATIYQGVYKVNGAYIYSYDIASSSLKRELKQGNEYTHRSFSLAEFTSAFHDRFLQSLRNVLSCDVPYGLLLSGGIDSTYILVSMIEELGIKPVCYTLKESESIEWYNIMALKEKYNLDLKAIDHPDSFEDIAYHAVRKMDTPFIDPAYFSLYSLIAQIPENVKVLLSGDGADELFWSYSDTRLLFTHSKIISLLKPLILILTNLHSHFAKYLLLQDCDKKVKWMEYKSRIEKREIYPFESDPDKAIKSNLSQRLLIKSDKASMAFSKEMRSPFLDKHLLEICSEARFRGLDIGSKRVMIDYICSKVPKIKKIRKRGFNSGGQSASFEFLHSEDKDLISYIINGLD